jgi:hypothetical protein
MADRDGDSAFWSRLDREDLPHCGQCDPSRHAEGADGRLIRCPTCHPLQGDPMPQARPRPGEPAAEARRMLEERPRPDKRAGQAAAPAALTGAALARAQLAEARAARLERTEPADGQPPDGDAYPF